MTTLADYYDRLERHDWHYAKSDDHRVWKAGNMDRVRIIGIAEESQAHKDLWHKWYAYMNKTEFDTGKPVRPE